MQVPPLPPVLVAKAAALRMHAHELSAENDFCDTCKLVVTEAASILGNLVSSIPRKMSLLCAYTPQSFRTVIAIFTCGVALAVSSCQNNARSAVLYPHQLGL